MGTGIMSTYDQLRETLDTAERFIDRGLAQTANEYTLLVMARALVDIAETLRMPHHMETGTDTHALYVAVQGDRQ